MSSISNAALSCARVMTQHARPTLVLTKLLRHAALAAIAIAVSQMTNSDRHNY